jgi:hypothetical protein
MIEKLPLTGPTVNWGETSARSETREKSERTRLKLGRLKVGV